MLVLGLIAVLFLSFHGSRSLPKHRSAPGRTVYVDLDALTHLHPCFNVLMATEELSRRYDYGFAKVGHRTIKHFSELGLLPGPVQKPEVDRADLVAETALTAVGEFSRLEAGKREALRLRLQQIRSTIENSVKPQLAAELREIERAASAREREIVSRIADQRLRAAIRVISLRAAVQHVKSTFTSSSDMEPGGSFASLEASLQEAIAEQQRIDDILNKETAAVRSEAAEKARDVITRKQAEVENQLAELEMVERTRIEAAIADARNEVFSGLVLPEDVEQPRWLRGIAFPTTRISSTRPAYKADYDSKIRRRNLLTSFARSLRTQIRSEIAQKVHLIAKQKGIKVSFDPGLGLPSATRQFERLLRSDSAICWNPVLAVAQR